MRAFLPVRRRRSPIAFLIGCGRSGTTLLGELLGTMPGVHYLHEPYAAWAAVDPRLDFSGLYTAPPHHVFMDADHVDPLARGRFERIFLRSGLRGVRLIVEKTPTNSFRIAYLHSLAPQARFIHIVRDGRAVVPSIERVAKLSRPIAGRGSVNDWWGVGDTKWQRLAIEGAERGYHADVVSSLKSHTERAAYEWITSIHEVDRWREALGTSLIEVRYEDLALHPNDELARILAFLELPSSVDRVLAATRRVRHGSSNHPPVALPAGLAQDFASLRERLGFAEDGVESEARARTRTT
ncbi:MAG: sulfotransferase [Actinomycetota bacterium]|nr:sulfotransferase [Actinomycetota bacterium]